MRTLFALLCLSAVAHANPSATSKPSNNLELTASIEPSTFAVTLSLRNVGKTPLKVHSHVEAGERHYDWYSVALDYPGLDSNKACTQRHHVDIEFVMARDESAQIDVTIEPGKSISHTIDLPKWANRERSFLGGGYYKLTAEYKVRPDPGVWTGTLETPPIHVVALDPKKGNTCKPTNWDSW